MSGLMALCLIHFNLPFANGSNTALHMLNYSWSKSVCFGSSFVLQNTEVKVISQLQLKHLILKPSHIILWFNWLLSTSSIDYIASLHFLFLAQFTFQPTSPPHLPALPFKLCLMSDVIDIVLSCTRGTLCCCSPCWAFPCRSMKGQGGPTYNCPSEMSLYAMIASKYPRFCLNPRELVFLFRN